MSFVSNGSLNEKTTPYIGIRSRSGSRPYSASSSAARSSASGNWRKCSQIGGAPGWQRSIAGVPVEIAAAGDRPLASDVEGGERIELTGIGLAGDHPVLLLRRWIGRRRLHAAEFERRALILVEIGENRRGLDGLDREAQRRRRAHGPLSLGYWSSVFGHEAAADPVKRPRPVYIVLDDCGAGRAAGSNGRVQLIDRRLFESEWLVVGHRLAPCTL